MSSISENEDRRAVVLRRAAELTPGVGPSGEAELSAEHLVEVAVEAGIAPEALLAALAEDRVEVNGERGVIDRVVGPRRLWDTRIVDADDPEQALNRWLQAGHGLRTWTRPDGVIIATPQRSLAGKLSSAVRRAGNQGRFHVAQNVQAVAVDVDAGPAAVCAVVDVGNRRTEALVAGSAVTSVSVLAVVGLAVVAGPLTLIGLPAAVGLGAAVSRLTFGRTVHDMRQELDRTLDGIARGEDPPTLLAAVAGRLRSIQG